MVIDPELAVRDEIGAVLRAAPAVTALVGERIRDVVPSDQEADLLPWICMGPISTRRVQIGSGPNWTVTARVLCETGDYTRREAWQIARAAMRALEDHRGEYEAGFLGPFEIVGAGDVNDPGGIKTVAFDVTVLMADEL